MDEAGCIICGKPYLRYVEERKGGSRPEDRKTCGDKDCQKENEKQVRREWKKRNQAEVNARQRERRRPKFRGACIRCGDEVGQLGAGYCRKPECRKEQQRVSQTRRNQRKNGKIPPVQLVLEDVCLVLHCDSQRGISFADVHRRFDVALEAREHLSELGAGEAYRQALVELSAACVEVASLLNDRPSWGESLSSSEQAAIRQRAPLLDEVAA